jgi:hypothetical protein
MLWVQATRSTIRKSYFATGEAFLTLVLESGYNYRRVAYTSATDQPWAHPEAAFAGRIRRTNRLRNSGSRPVFVAP